MMGNAWVGVLYAVLCAAAVAALVFLGLRRTSCRSAQACGFMCPNYRSYVDCEIVQDVRTGQWKELRSCSIYRRVADLPCDQDCVRRLNLGFRLEGWDQTTLS
jgi:hypothetical protein